MSNNSYQAGIAAAMQNVQTAQTSLHQAQTPGIQSGLGGTSVYGAALQPNPLPYSLPMARNPLADHCALAVYERRISLKTAAKEMPGDYDLNRKLLGDVFLMSPCRMTLEQAASLAFVLKEETESFLQICDQAGSLIPSGG